MSKNNLLQTTLSMTDEEFKEYYDHGAVDRKETVF